MMRWMLIAALLVCTGCATTYHDQGAFKGKGGFQDVSLRPNHHSISYVGGQTLDTTIAAVFGLRRAAELAKADGKPGFVIQEGSGKVMASTMTTMMNGVMSQSTSYTPSVDLFTESRMPPASDDDKLVYYDADKILRLSAPYVDNGEKLTGSIRKLNERLAEPGARLNAEVMADLYASLIFSTNMERDDVQFRLGYLAGLFRDKAVAREWAARDYLPKGQIMIGIALQMNGHKELLDTFAKQNHWPKELVTTVTGVKAEITKLKSPLVRGMQAATGDASIAVERNASIYQAALETYVTLLDTTKPGAERAVEFVNTSRVLEALAKENPEQTVQALEGLKGKLAGAGLDISKPVVLGEMFMPALSNKVGAMPALQLAEESNARRMLLAVPQDGAVSLAVILKSPEHDTVRLTMELYTPSGKKHLLAYATKVKGVKEGLVRHITKIDPKVFTERGIYRLDYGVRTEWLGEDAKAVFYFPKF